ncbi:MmcQ/YjbR family DNA-binding protein [Caulobacter sp. UNC358MFTsu5.1]|uniref:MmcQ/YjbR family DNA-binding protein n=1 Tax=Caulobacter sp. UNC358MFTsu5.1 TaxID=1449049 RepID=UPI0004A74495|nr:MmcQ/YjbR family DNA-binding protein [Caulobacter sp. UNC358MFTsu5.1]
MTPDDFRRLALALPDAVESSHMGTVDFRVGRIFATLGYPNANFGMVQLTREHQDVIVGVEPKVFRPVPGNWGLKGATLVVLAEADEPTLRGALEAAWRLKANKRQLALLEAARVSTASTTSP